MIYRILISLFAAFVFISCDDFGKVLKNPDFQYKIERANGYFEEGRYANALTLYENVFPLIRGTKDGEEVYFRIAECNYKMGDFYSAAYYYKAFGKTFPKSKKSEKSAFLAAYCSYSTSPEYDLDQTDTQKAIDDLQLFQLKFPQSSWSDSAQVLIRELTFKLEKKQFENAKTYHRTSRHKAAIIALNNTIKAFPNSIFSEEIYFLLFKSNFELAMNSVASKKEERLEAAEKAYYEYIDRYADSERAKEAESLFKKIQRQQQS